MSPRTYEAASLSEIIHKNHVVALVERGVPARLALEFEGDTALFQGRYRDALASYRAARGASWRVRAKMGWCCFHLK